MNDDEELDVRSPDVEEARAYVVAGARVPRELVDEYIGLRYSSGRERVHLHRLILRHVDEPYGGPWWHEFEAWVEEQLQRPRWVRYFEKQASFVRSHPFKCRRCGRRFSVHEAFLQHLERGCD